MLNHLKNTHKNVIILTHKSEIKDFADFVIEVKKVTDSVPSEILAKNPDAGVSRLTIQ
jgi:DNA repair exonuclease SbcCD ATPase subunit